MKKIYDTNDLENYFSFEQIEAEDKIRQALLAREYVYWVKCIDYDICTLKCRSYDAMLNGSYTVHDFIGLMVLFETGNKYLGKSVETADDVESTLLQVLRLETTIVNSLDPHNNQTPFTAALLANRPKIAKAIMVHPSFDPNNKYFLDRESGLYLGKLEKEVGWGHQSLAIADKKSFNKSFVDNSIYIDYLSNPEINIPPIDLFNIIATAFHMGIYSTDKI